MEMIAMFLAYRSLCGCFCCFRVVLQLFEDGKDIVCKWIYALEVVLSNKIETYFPSLYILHIRRLEFGSKCRVFCVSFHCFPLLL